MITIDDIAGIWAIILNIDEPVTETTDVIDLGAESRDYLTFAELMQDRYGLRISPADLVAASSVADMADLVTAAVEAGRTT